MISEEPYKLMAIKKSTLHIRSIKGISQMGSNRACCKIDWTTLRSHRRTYITLHTRPETTPDQQVEEKSVWASTLGKETLPSTMVDLPRGRIALFRIGKTVKTSLSLRIWAYTAIWSMPATVKQDTWSAYVTADLEDLKSPRLVCQQKDYVLLLRSSKQS